MQTQGAKARETGAEQVRWELSDLYKDVDDPQIDRDLEELLRAAEQFGERHRGHLAETLGDALRARAEIQCRADKLMVYLFLRRSTDATNARIEQRIARVQEAWSRAEADHMNFFDHEL